MTVDFVKLPLPFLPSQVSWRIGSTNAEKTRGLALAYLDARDVMERLDWACSPQGWQAIYPHAGQKTVCSIGIWCGPELGWVYKSNGAGDSDIEAEKGALSDAFKRAAVLWGIGRYLYSLPSPWVEIETRGRSSVIKDTEYAKLEAILAKASGAPSRPSLPPVDSDTMAGATRWASDAIGFLNAISTDEDHTAWSKKNAPALKKLKGVSEDLYEKVMDASRMAQDRARTHL